MSEMPWIRFFPSDWLGGTRGMSAAETGIYITLIATMYERGEPVPEEHARLARLCGASRSTFKSALDALIEEGKIVRVDGGLWNERVAKESEVRAEKSEVGRKAAQARWDEKDSKNNDSVDADAMRSQSVRNANQKPETRKKEQDSGFAAAQPPPELPLELPITTEPVTKHRKGGGLGSAEDRFWAMAPQAAERGVAKSLLGQLSNALNGDFERGIGIVGDALAAKSPRPYLAKIIRNVAAERAPPAVVGVPSWIMEARAGGYPVTREGRFWRMSGALYDDEGEQIGN